MKLYAQKDAIMLEHNGISLEFGNHKPRYSEEDKKKFKWTHDVFLKKHYAALFVEINEYWKSLPKKAQDEMFAIYEGVHEDIMESPTQAERYHCILEATKELIEGYHKFEDLAKFMEGRELIHTANVNETFNQGIHDNILRSTTYIRSEYEDLAALTVIFRAMLPIWNFNIRFATNGNEKAAKVFYEIEMFSILAKTSLIHVDAFRRLDEFVSAQWEKFVTGKTKQDAKKSILSSTAAGIGTSEIPNYLLATVVVNKLAYREINAFRDEGDLITNVYQRVETEVKKLATKFESVKAKVINKSGNDEDKTGYLESFRTREKVRHDVYLVNQVYLYDYRSAKRALDDDIPASLVTACINSLMKYPPQPIRKDQLTLVQWTLSSIIVPRAIGFIDRRAMINAMGLTQAALIHWRLRNLANLISSEPVDGNEDVIVSNTFDNVNADLTAQLKEIFPHYRFSRGTTSRRRMCPGLQATHAFSVMIADQIWNLRCTKQIEDELRQESGEFKPHKSLKDEVASLLIKVNRVNKE